MSTDVKVISTRAELVALARELGVRADWHEPDEQKITVVINGTHMQFDNATRAGQRFGEDDSHAELHATIHRIHWDDEYHTWRLGRAIAHVNLAMLFAWATGYDERPSRSELL